MEPQLIDTVDALKAFLQSLPPCRERRPDLYVDLEGDDLCRQGTLSIVTIFVESQRSVHLVDVTTLKDVAFSTVDFNGRTLKSILEARDVIKVFFDIRNDSDALFSHYGVAVQGIEDVQLMELAARPFSKRVVNGLAKCIMNNSDIVFHERRAWNEVKERRQRIFKTGSDGYAIFDRRPLAQDVLDYSVQDVTFLPKLRDSYRANLCDASWRKIQQETLARIALSQSPSYNGKGRHMALGPPSWQSWHPSPAEKQEQSLLQEEQRVKDVSTIAAAQSAESKDESSDLLQDAVVEVFQNATPRGRSPEIDTYDDDFYSGRY